MKTITIEGQLRSEFGKKATRQIRSEEQVPCVIYGGAETVNFAAPAPITNSVVLLPFFATVAFDTFSIFGFLI